MQILIITSRSLGKRHYHLTEVVVGLREVEMVRANVATALWEVRRPPKFAAHVAHPDACCRLVGVSCVGSKQADTRPTEDENSDESKRTTELNIINKINNKIK